VDKWFSAQTANILTSFRVLVVPFFALALFGEGPSSGVLALVLFAAGGASDYLDGYVARKTGTRTAFGEFLDPLADKLLTGSAFLSFAFIPELGIPLWLVIVILAREVFLTLFRATAIGKGKTMRTEHVGKLKTAFQFFAITCILLILLGEKMKRAGIVSRSASAVRPLPLILVAISAFLALLSLASYIRNNRDLLLTQSVKKGESGLLHRAATVLSSVCFIGYLPRGGGTAAAIAGSAVWIFLSRSLVYYFAAAAALIGGVFVAGYAEKRVFREKDSQRIVIDEVAGVLVTFLTFQFSFSARGAALWAAGFVLFRFFDILKPPPINRLHSIPGGAGVMLDDAASGISANLLLQIARHFLPRVFG
jgi:CDP-diacylglycerol---glycerol-3-phosphate 3-phosphatidyltransferase